MKRQDWTGKRVRRKSEPKGRVGVVNEPWKFNGWWLVLWPDGKMTQEPQRGLIVVEEPQS